MSKEDDIIPLVMPNKNSVIFLVELKEKCYFFGRVKVKWSFLLLNPRKKDLFLDHIQWRRIIPLLNGDDIIYLGVYKIDRLFFWSCKK